MPKVPAVSAEVLLQEALTALDACFTTLARVDERIRALAQASEAEHQSVQRHLSHVEPTSRRSKGTGPLPALPDGATYTIDQDAIYHGELALRQEIMHLHALHSKLDYLANLVRSGYAQLVGHDDEDAAAVPWAAAVKAARIEAQEEERMRLAREVHDGPAQVLANAMIGLEYCQMVASRAPAELDVELQRLREMMRDGLIEVRRFMFDLRPTMLATMGLNATLGRYVEDFQRAFDLPVELVLPREELAIDDRAQIAIFRIVQESLQNVQKHAGATRIRIELACLADNSVRLVISDDGKGFEPQAMEPTTRSGAGLFGMQERATMLGGSLVVNSAPARGTVITLHVPPGPGRSAGAQQGAGESAHIIPQAADRRRQAAGGEGGPSLSMS